MHIRQVESQQVHDHVQVHVQGHMHQHPRSERQKSAGHCTGVVVEMDNNDIAGSGADSGDVSGYADYNYADGGDGQTAQYRQENTDEQVQEHACGNVSAASEHHELAHTGAGSGMDPDIGIDIHFGIGIDFVRTIGHFPIH